ncbi:hypothetical protein LDC_0165, partial [sediment metagenome]
QEPGRRVGDYTSGALDGYDQDDVKGLLENRLDKAREDLEDAREAVKALCEPVDAPDSRRITSTISVPSSLATPNNSRTTSRNG